MSTEPVYGVEIAGDLADFGAQLVELKFVGCIPTALTGGPAGARCPPIALLWALLCGVRLE